MMTRGHGTTVRLGLGLLMAAGATARIEAQTLPFGPGEELVYEVRVAPMGRVGKGTLRVERAEAIRGQKVYRLSFDFTAKVGPLRAVQRSDSWLDPERLMVLRFHKRESQPLARDRSEQVEIYPEERRWQAADGERGRAPTTAPLDELSLLYYVRLLPLDEGEEVRLERHFDPERNPVIVKALGREMLTVPAGTFSAMVFEMRVRDPNRYRGEGRIRLHILDDDRRTPVRIQTTLPDAGTITLELQAVRLVEPDGPARVAARRP